MIEHGNPGPYVAPDPFPTSWNRCPCLPSGSSCWALPFKVGVSRVYRVFAERGVHEKAVWIGSGKLGFPESALLAFCLGADMIGGRGKP